MVINSVWEAFKGLERFVEHSNKGHPCPLASLWR